MSKHIAKLLEEFHIKSVSSRVEFSAWYNTAVISEENK